MADSVPSLLPVNSTALERALEQVLAARLKRYEAAADVIATLWNPWTCPAVYLPWLAYEMAVPYWRADWPEDKKRALIAAAPAINSRRGHEDAIHRGLDAIGLKMEITPWHCQQLEGRPGTFMAVLWRHDNPDLARSTIDDAQAMVRATKRQSQHPDFRIGQQDAAAIGFTALAALRQTISADTPASTRDGAAAGIGFAGGGHSAPRFNAIARAA